MRFARCCGVVLFLVVSALLGAGFVAYRYATAPPATASVQAPIGRAVASTTAVPAAVDAAGTPVALPPAQSLDQKVGALEREVASATPGSRKPVSIAVTEAELNAKLGQQTIKSASFQLASPTVELTPGLVTVRGVYTGSGFEGVPMGVSMTVSAQNGTIVPTVDRVDVNGLTVPLGVVPQLRDQITSQLRRALEQQSATLPLVVTNVQVGSHMMTVEGTTK